MEQYSKWDLTDILKTPDDTLAAIEVAIKENDGDFLMKILKSLQQSEVGQEFNSSPQFILKLLYALGFMVKPQLTAV